MGSFSWAQPAQYFEIHWQKISVIFVPVRNLSKMLYSHISSPFTLKNKNKIKKINLSAGKISSVHCQYGCFSTSLSHHCGVLLFSLQTQHAAAFLRGCKIFLAEGKFELWRLSGESWKIYNSRLSYPSEIVRMIYTFPGAGVFGFSRSRKKKKKQY